MGSRLLNRAGSGLQRPVRLAGRSGQGGEYCPGSVFSLWAGTCARRGRPRSNPAFDEIFRLRFIRRIRLLGRAGLILGFLVCAGQLWVRASSWSEDRLRVQLALGDYDAVAGQADEIEANYPEYLELARLGVQVEEELQAKPGPIRLRGPSHPRPRRPGLRSRPPLGRPRRAPRPARPDPGCQLARRHHRTRRGGPARGLRAARTLAHKGDGPAVGGSDIKHFAAGRVGQEDALEAAGADDEGVGVLVSSGTAKPRKTMVAWAEVDGLHGLVGDDDQTNPSSILRNHSPLRAVFPLWNYCGITEEPRSPALLPDSQGVSRPPGPVPVRPPSHPPSSPRDLPGSFPRASMGALPSLPMSSVSSAAIFPVETLLEASCAFAAQLA